MTPCGMSQRVCHMPTAKGEGAIGGQRRGHNEGPIRQLLQRLGGDELVEQAGQRDVDEEELHPGEPALGAAHELGAEEAEADQPEERRQEVEEPDEVGHGGSGGPARPLQPGLRGFRRVSGPGQRRPRRVPRECFT